MEEIVGLVNRKILASKELSLYAKGLYGYLASFPDEIYPSTETVMEENQLSKKELAQYYKELEDFGIIRNGKLYDPFEEKYYSEIINGK